METKRKVLVGTLCDFKREFMRNGDLYYGYKLSVIDPITSEKKYYFFFIASKEFADDYQPHMEVVVEYDNTYLIRGVTQTFVCLNNPAVVVYPGTTNPYRACWKSNKETPSLYKVTISNEAKDILRAAYKLDNFIVSSNSPKLIEQLRNGCMDPDNINKIMHRWWCSEKISFEDKLSGLTAFYNIMKADNEDFYRSIAGRIDYKEKRSNWHVSDRGIPSECIIAISAHDGTNDLEEFVLKQQDYVRLV